MEKTKIELDALRADMRKSKIDIYRVSEVTGKPYQSCVKIFNGYLPVPDNFIEDVREKLSIKRTEPDLQTLINKRAHLENMAREILRCDDVETADSLSLERAVIRSYFPHITKDMQKEFSQDRHSGYFDAASHIYNQNKTNLEVKKCH